MDTNNLCGDSGHMEVKRFRALIRVWDDWRVSSSPGLLGLLELLACSPIMHEITVFKQEPRYICMYIKVNKGYFG